MITVPLTVEHLQGWRDPAVVFAAIEPRYPDVFWLDAGGTAVDGWSMVGVGAAVTDESAVRAVEVGGSQAPSGWMAGPFRGGWIGWLAYEEAAAHFGAPVADSDAVEDRSAWLHAEKWFAFDHARRQVWSVSTTDSTPWTFSPEDLGESPSSPVPASRTHAVSRDTPTEYAALIGECREAIRAGDAYQLCLTTRFTVDTPDAPPEVYARLRASSPAHHGGFIRVGGVCLLSASPEQFLFVDDGRVSTKPIKGTRPRSADAATDAALVAELLASAKERAENVMIVDLMRNDLSRVSEAGSVRVDALLAIESYPHVHQLVSTVSGILRPHVTLDELLARAFPAGSMTGAPKLSAMTILHRLEHAARGVYAGAFGWVGEDGSLDLAMVIRTIVMAHGRATVGAGGGITWSSIAHEEVEEVGVKARAPLAALGASLPPGW